MLNILEPGLLTTVQDLGRSALVPHRDAAFGRAG